ncbi:MAG: MoxR family ATPase [Spirochaetales bacterium]|nr:MoxR family ATPase [Spirochaetales bacterium]
MEINRKETEELRGNIARIKTEIQKAVVGHEMVIDEILVCLLCGGHALLEGVPGLGKTYLIKTLGEVLDLEASRVQFTPDLMPADIIGTNILVSDSQDKNVIRFQKGPVFTQILLADEINRATPKTQSALLEAMQEHTVTVAGQKYVLDEPFIVLATQNPIEMEGTYPLPEAQMDRFLFKLKVDFPDIEDLSVIIDRTTTGAEPSPGKVLDAKALIKMKKLIREVPVAEEVKNFALRLVLATHSDSNEYKVSQYIRYGASPRGAQSIILASKVFALIDGRYNIGFEDIERAAIPALRHRLILSFEGEAEGISPEEIIESLLKEIPRVQ